MSSVFVRSPRASADVESALTVALPGAKIEELDGLLMAELPELGGREVEGSLRDLSGQLEAEVFWIAYQSVVDGFQYHHWQSGRQLRSLVFGWYQDERTWERVEGEREPWEKKVLFDLGKLEDLLLYAKSADEREKLTGIWREQDLQPGCDQPDVIGEDCANRVVEAVGLG